MAPFTFSACNIAIGEKIEFYCSGNNYTGTLCEVIDGKHVSYNGETCSLTALAKHLTGVKSAYKNGKLTGREHPNPDYLFEQLLYQGLTRVRSKLALVICSATILENILPLLKSS